MDGARRETVGTVLLKDVARVVGCSETMERLKKIECRAAFPMPCVPQFDIALLARVFGECRCFANG